MIKKLKLMILSLSYIFALALPMLAISPALAATPATTSDIKNNLCKGSNLDLSSTSVDCTNSDISGSGQSVTDLIKKIITILSVVIGAVAVVMIIIGGFRYVTSAGNAESTKSARQTIIYAIVGLIIVALAQIIVHFVLNAVD